MELVLIAVIPGLFLMLGTGMLIVSQLTSFFQYRRYMLEQTAANTAIARFIRQLAEARNQLYRRSMQLEGASRSLRSSNSELERLNTLKSKFLSMAVHDVRTPLTAIRGFGGMLYKERLGKKGVRNVDNIMTAANQIGRLMGDLTDLAVIEAGKLRMDPAPFDAGLLAQEVFAAVALVGSQKDVACELAEYPEGLAIVADRFRVSQVLMNLLNNAVKFTPPGGRVELRVRPAPRSVTFLVKDTGPGIHPSERQRIFEKFYQSQFLKEEGAKRQGWGLGLSIALEVVRAHQGEIGVDSQGLGRGSTFWFRIPLAPPIRPAARPAPARSAAAAARPAQAAALVRAAPPQPLRAVPQLSARATPEATR